MYGCLQSSLYNMTAELYHQITSQDENTNAIERRWVILKKISCSIVPIRESGGSATSDNKIFDKDYIEELEIKMYSSERLSKRWRVSQIRNSNQEEAYVEMDRVSQPSTIFEVFASHPIFDMFGNVQYHENHLKRVMVQSND